MATIKFVYFDVGGVAILDFSGTNKWEKLLNEFEITEEFWEKHYGNINIGEISKESPIPYDKLLEGFVSRFEKNPAILPVILTIKQKCRIGLLTNMYPGMLDSIKNHGLFPDIHWDVIIDSSVEKVAKPDREIFELAEKMCNASGEEILFVENTEKHIQMAKTFDWQTFLYDPANPQKSSDDLLKFYFSVAASGE